MEAGQDLGADRLFRLALTVTLILGLDGPVGGERLPDQVSFPFPVLPVRYHFSRQPPSLPPERSIRQNAFPRSPPPPGPSPPSLALPS